MHMFNSTKAKRYVYRHIFYFVINGIVVAEEYTGLYFYCNFLTMVRNSFEFIRI